MSPAVSSFFINRSDNDLFTGRAPIHRYMIRGLYPTRQSQVLGEFSLLFHFHALHLIYGIIFKCPFVPLSHCPFVPHDFVELSRFGKTQAQILLSLLRHLTSSNSSLQGIAQTSLALLLLRSSFDFVEFRRDSTELKQAWILFSLLRHFNI